MDIPLLSEVLSYIFVDSCITIAGVTTVAYDYLCTLKEEMTYAWSCPWSLGLVLFYLNRYLPFLDQTVLLYIRFLAKTPETCFRLFGVSLSSISVGLLSAQIILCLRTCGMWEKQRWVMVSLGTLMSLSILFAICITVLQLRSATIETTPIGYFVELSRGLSLSVFISILLVESTIGGLTILKANKYFRQSRSLWVGQVYRSGILYCFCILLLSLANIVLMCTPSSGIYRAILICPTRVFHSICGNRIMLLILRHRYKMIQRHHANSRNVTTPLFLTSVVPDLAWETMDISDIELSKCVEGTEEEDWIRS